MLLRVLDGILAFIVGLLMIPVLPFALLWASLTLDDEEYRYQPGHEPSQK